MTEFQGADGTVSLTGRLRDPGIGSGRVLTTDADGIYTPQLPAPPFAPQEGTYGGGAPLTIANGATAKLPWSFGSGVELLTLTDPDDPAVVAPGVYAFAVQVSALSPLTVGGYCIIRLTVGNAVVSAQALHPNTTAGVTATALLGVPSPVNVQVTNLDGAASADYLIQTADVLRIA